MRLLLILAVFGLALSGNPAIAAPPTSTAAEPLRAITMHTPSNPGHSGEASGFFDCNDKDEPLMEVYFSAEGKGDVEVVASTSTDLSDKKAQFWRKTVVYPGNKLPLRVEGIPGHPDGTSEYTIYVVSLESTTQAGQTPMTANHEMCKTDSRANALLPNPEKTSVWANPWTWVFLVVGGALCFVASRTSRPR